MLQKLIYSILSLEFPNFYGFFIFIIIDGRTCYGTTVRMMSFDFYFPKLLSRRGWEGMHDVTFDPSC